MRIIYTHTLELIFAIWGYSLQFLFLSYVPRRTANWCWEYLVLYTTSSGNGLTFVNSTSHTRGSPRSYSAEASEATRRETAPVT